MLALTKKNESFSNRLETVENDLAALKLSNQETGQDKRKLREQFSTLEQQIEKLDRENRATNIIIEGLNLDKGNDEVLESVQKLFENTLEVRVHRCTAAAKMAAENLVCSLFSNKRSEASSSSADFSTF